MIAYTMAVLVMIGALFYLRHEERKHRKDKGFKG